MSTYILLFLVLALVFVLVLAFALVSVQNPQSGGSRDVIFNRFSYQPEFPFISQFDTVDLNRFSKAYNVPGPIKFLYNRPYSFYHTKASTWLYPWEFPQEINYRCIEEAERKCRENKIQINKQGVDKLGGLAIQTRSDVVHTSPCYNRIYDQCIKRHVQA